MTIQPHPLEHGAQEARQGIMNGSERGNLKDLQASRLYPGQAEQAKNMLPAEVQALREEAA